MARVSGMLLPLMAHLNTSSKFPNTSDISLTLMTCRVREHGVPVSSVPEGHNMSHSTASAPSPLVGSQLVRPAHLYLSAMKEPSLRLKTELAPKHCLRGHQGKLDIYLTPVLQLNLIPASRPAY
jgi:hypothetical protein